VHFGTYSPSLCQIKSSCWWPQAQLTERALELLALPDDGQTRLLLDLGCGSGLSGAALTEQGHAWVVRLNATLMQPALCFKP